MTPSWMDPEARAAFSADPDRIMETTATVAAGAPTGAEVLANVEKWTRILAAAPPVVTEIRCGTEALDLLRRQATRDRPEHVGLLGVPVRVDKVLPPTYAAVCSGDKILKVLVLVPPRRAWWRRLVARLARIVGRPS